MSNAWAQVIAEGPDDLRAILIESIHADLHHAFESLDARKFERIGYLIHRLKGSASLIGATAEVAFDACCLVERVSRECGLDLMHELLTQVENAFNEALKALDHS